ncbi:hypothetical protein KDW49_22430 [Burkholderia dolosa]|uniref:hypothetical protein n=1 Tax=Burkholderia dolosa TaxID=152500 RepID=UPI001BA13433|nr:hypothetical protein [Burkholderia dolosa]MBR8303469.1 hypothetical protein [Burkholderia dolosa]
MKKIYFRGRVLPNQPQVSINYMPSIKWKDVDWDVALEFLFRIQNSNVDVECQLEAWLPEYFPQVHQRALDICRAQVDVVAFSQGIGLTVIFDTFTDPDGRITSIAHANPELATLCTAYSLEHRFDEVCRAVIEQPLLFMALRELITAISLPHVSLVECARAMDRLKNLIAAPGSSPRSAWSQLRDVLHIDEAYLKYITDASADPRHGQPGHTPAAVTMEVTRRAWTIMNRYLEYVLQGAVPLDPDRFPTLGR